jgi:hypothetical protein
MASLNPIPVTFTVFGPSNAGQVVITINSGQGQFSFGPSQGQLLNYFAIKSVAGGVAQFQELTCSSSTIVLQANTSGTTSLVVCVWITPEDTAQVNGNVRLPTGFTFTPHGPNNQSGTQTSSGGWFVS